MSIVNPLCTNIDNAIASQYSEVNFVKTIEYNGNYVIALMTEPFFRMSSKNTFNKMVLDDICKQFDISSNNVKLTYDLDIIYDINNIQNDEDIKNIVAKVK